MNSPEPNRTESINRVFVVIFGPLIDYSEGLRRAAQPVAGADYILSVQGRPENIAKFMLGSLFLTSIADLISPGQGSLSITASSVVNDCFMLLVFVLSGLLTTAIVYMPLRWLGGRAKFTTTLASSVYLTAIYYPIISLVEALFSFFIDIGEHNYGAYAMLYPFTVIVARIHGITLRKTAVAVFGSLIAFSAVAVPALVAYENHVKTNPPSRDELVEMVKKSILGEWNKKPALHDAKIEKIELTNNGYTQSEGHEYNGFIVARLDGQLNKLKINLVYKEGRISWRLSAYEP